jgi:hypothetical protein
VKSEMGLFFYDPTEEKRNPLWKKYLDETSDAKIAEIGLSRYELEKILRFCYDQRIIN